MHLRGGIALPVVRDVAFAVAAGRMRGARRPVGRRQELDPEDDLRQLPRDAGADPRPPRRRAGRHRQRRAAHACSTCAATRIGYVSQFLRVVPRVAALDIVAEPLVATAASRDEARRARPSACCAGSTCPSGCGRCRPRPSPAASSSGSTSRAASSPTSDPAARRADRLARRRQPRRRVELIAREEARRRRHRRHLP